MCFPRCSTRSSPLRQAHLSPFADALTLGPKRSPKHLPALPPELLLHIVQLSVPPASPGDDLSERLACLVAFSQASHAFKDIAELEMYRAVILYDSRAVRRFSETLQARPELAPLVKILFLGRTKTRIPLDWSAPLQALLGLCVNLEQLNLGTVRDVEVSEVLRCPSELLAAVYSSDWPLIVSHADLQALSAINTSFEGFEGTRPPNTDNPPRSPLSTPLMDSSPLPLRHLDLGRCTLPPGSFPSASALPHLSALAVWLTPEEADTSHVALVELFRAAEPTLRALTISGSVQSLIDSSLRRMSALELVDCWDFGNLDVLDALTHSVRRIHINVAGRTKAARTPLAISILQQRLARPHVEVALSALQEVRISFEKPPREAPDFAELAQACKARSVRLHYDLRPSLGVHFETEYWRAVREQERAWR